KRAKITPGMNREQVLMSLGYPMSSENPDLESNLWRYWLSSFAEFQVQFDANGRVREITTDANTRNLVWVD
ncbi:MAG: outer membrane protein assembly factor BamE, partial [Luteimonas sp.]